MKKFDMGNHKLSVFVSVLSANSVACFMDSVKFVKPRYYWADLMVIREKIISSGYDVIMWGAVVEIWERESDERICKCSLSDDMQYIEVVLECFLAFAQYINDK